MNASGPGWFWGLELPTVLGLAAVLLWSTTVAVGRSVTEQLGPITAAAAIYGLAGGASLGYLLISGGIRARVSRFPPRYLWGCGTLFAGYMLLLYLALGTAADRGQVLAVGLVNHLWPTLTILLSVPLLKTRPAPLLIPGLGLASAGVFCTLTSAGPLSLESFITTLRAHPLPFLFAFAGAIAWALYSNLSRRWAGEQGGGGVALFVLGAGVLLLLVRGGCDEASQWSTRAILEVVYLSSAVTLAYVFWDLAVRRGDLILVAAGSYLIPFFSTAIACLYLGVAPGARLWIGCGLIILGAIVCKKSVRETRSWKFENERTP